MIITNGNAEAFFKSAGIVNFKPSDFACHCCGKMVIDSRVISAAQFFRNDIGMPIDISSGYRCQKYNDSLKNSVKNSEHVAGHAFDMELKRYDPRELALVFLTAFVCGLFTGIGIDADFMHLDIKEGELRSWVYR